jgi:hypothetical protein
MHSFFQRFKQSLIFGFSTSFKKVLVISLLFFVGSALLFTIFGGSTMFEFAAVEFSPAMTDVEIEAQMLQILQNNMFSIGIGYILFILLSIFTAVYVTLIALYPKASVKKLFGLTRTHGIRYLLAALLAGILMLIPYAIGMIIMAAAGPLAGIGVLVMIVSMALLAPFAMLLPLVAIKKKVNGWKALQLTRQYLKGKYWTIFWNIVGFIVLSLILLWIIMIILMFIGIGTGSSIMIFLIIVAYLIVNYLYQASMMHFLADLLHRVKK